MKGVYKFTFNIYIYTFYFFWEKRAWCGGGRVVVYEGGV